MISFLNTVWNWLILSSADENKLSATIKGSAIFTIAIAVASIFHIDLSNISTSLVSLIVALSQICGALYAAYGAIRKLYRTFKSTNKVLNSPNI